MESWIEADAEGSRSLDVSHISHILGASEHVSHAEIDPHFAHLNPHYSRLDTLHTDVYPAYPWLHLRLPERHGDLPESNLSNWRPNTGERPQSPKGAPLEAPDYFYSKNQGALKTKEVAQPTQPPTQGKPPSQPIAPPVEVQLSDEMSQQEKETLNAFNQMNLTREGPMVERSTDESTWMDRSTYIAKYEMSQSSAGVYRIEQRFDEYSVLNQTQGTYLSASQQFPAWQVRTYSPGEERLHGRTVLRMMVSVAVSEDKVVPTIDQQRYLMQFASDIVRVPFGRIRLDVYHTDCWHVNLCDGPCMEHALIHQQFEDRMYNNAMYNSTLKASLGEDQWVARPVQGGCGDPVLRMVFSARVADDHPWIGSDKQTALQVEASRVMFAPLNSVRVDIYFSSQEMPDGIQTAMRPMPSEVHPNERLPDLTGGPGVGLLAEDRTPRASPPPRVQVSAAKPRLSPVEVTHWSIYV